MCLMIMERIRFNTWEAFNRAVERLKFNYGDKMIHGQIYIPAHLSFRTWIEFNKVIDEIRKFPHNEASTKNDDMYPIYGEFNVEITDPWNVGRD